MDAYVSKVEKKYPAMDLKDAFRKIAKRIVMSRTHSKKNCLPVSNVVTRVI